ncbi:MAG: LPS-assembly protein LptD [Hyphomonadaceae bacterium]|nr:LPS-assembly protein LptD [Hyphomonadaceae bacterium]
MSRSGEVADRWFDRAHGPWAAAVAAILLAAAGSTTAAAQEPVPVRVTSDQPVVVLEADTLVKDDASQTIVAEGNVEARYQGRTLRTKRLIYNLRDNTIRAQGGVEIIDPDGTVRYADEVEVDEELDTGVATGFGARIAGGGTAAAAAAVRPSPGVNQLQRVIYTACPICKVEGGKTEGPTWTLRARSATQDQNSKMISYRDVVLQFGGVPVIYLPYFAHPDPSSGPRSGLLPPDIGSNRRVGAFYQQPVHWAISPYQDLTIAPRVHANVNPILGFQYRKRFYSGDLRIDGSASYDQDFDGNGNKFGEESLRGHIFGNGLFKIDDFWSWGFGVERAADDLYLRRYDLDGETRARGPIIGGDNLRLVSQLFTTGQNENTFGSLSLVSIQGLRAVDDSTVLPLVLPLGELEHVMRDPLFDGQLKLQASTAALFRQDNGVDSARVSVGGEWRRDSIVGPGLVLAPFAQTRADIYRTGNAPTAKDETFTRSVGLAGVEVRYPFVRTGGNVDVIIEPIGMVAIGYGDNDARIINEDSLSFELDDTNLFRPNAAPNYDLWESGARGSLGVRATARTRDDKSASVMLGRRWREDSEPRFNRLTNLDDETSDWVGAVDADLGQNLQANVRFRVADKDLSLVRMDASVRASLWRLSTEARYFQVDEALRPGDPNREIRGGVGFRISDRWSFSYSLQRDLDSDINLSQNIHLMYRDDCTFLDFGYVRSETTDRVLGPNEGFQIRIGLTSLGMFGGGD